MFMTVSKIARKDGSQCSAADLEIIVPSIPTWDAYRDYIANRTTEGKVIYRSASINDAGEMETVTLYAAQEDYNTFKADPVWAPFETDLQTIYHPAVVTAEDI